MQRRLLGGAPGAGDSGLGVDHDRVDFDQPGLEQRPERQLRGGRIAAGIGHEIGRRDRGAGMLGEPVDGVALPFDRPVRLAVGPLVQGRIAQPEVGREVDDLGAARHLADHVLGGAVRQAAEHHVQRAEIEVADLGQPGQAASGEVREHRLDRLAGIALRGHADDARLGMVVQQAQELGAGVAGRAQDPDAHAVRRHRRVSFDRRRGVMARIARGLDH